MSKKQIHPLAGNCPEKTISSADDVSNPSDAKEYLENGSVAPVGRYLRDEAAPHLRSLAKPGHQRQAAGKLPGPDPDWPFEFDTTDVLWAIENGQWELVAQYPAELAKALTLLGDMLDPSGKSEFQLKPVRRRKGRPQNQRLTDPEGEIVRDLKSARSRLGKLEAAISEVGEKRKLARSTLFRIWGERNGSPVKSNKQRDSVSRAGRSGKK